MDPEEALEVKAEQALLEIEHLVSGAHEVEFAVEGGGERVRHDPSPELAAFLEDRASAAGLDRGTLLGLYVDLFARVFLDSEGGGPPGRPE